MVDVSHVGGGALFESYHGFSERGLGNVGVSSILVPGVIPHLVHKSKSWDLGCHPAKMNPLVRNHTKKTHNLE